MGYRINPVLVDSYEFVLNECSNDIISSLLLNSSDSYSHHGLKGIDMARITIEKEEALNWIDDNVSSIVDSRISSDYHKGLPESMSVEVRILRNYDEFITKYLSISVAEKWAEKDGLSFFYYKDWFIIADLYQFKKLATNRLLRHYRWQVNSFHPDNLILRRNRKTLRLYGHLTSLSSSLLQFVRINKMPVIQHDLKCSQFTLFANLINVYLNKSGEQLISLFSKEFTKKFIKGLVEVLDSHRSMLPHLGLSDRQTEFDSNDDVLNFLHDCLQDDLYQILKDKLNLTSRAHGKAISFRTVFAKPKPENELVKNFRILYPTVIRIINAFKENNGYNKFAIGLQRVEAEIFIDHILKKVLGMGVQAFTRHDSLVCPISILNGSVTGVIDSVFTNFGFIYNTNIESFIDEKDTFYWAEKLGVDFIDYEYQTDDYNTYLHHLREDIIKERTKKRLREKRWNKRSDRFREKLTEIREERLSNFLVQLSYIDLPRFIVEDYYEYVSREVLEELYEVEGMPESFRNLISDEIGNLECNYPVPFFQDETNEYIRHLIDLLNDAGV